MGVRMKKQMQALRAELQELQKARDVLNYSYTKSAKFNIGPGLDTEQLESLEALTSRFARLSDIIIQRIFRYLDAIDLEESGTARDRINRAEKREIIESAEQFIKIRLLRNEIAHEYKAEIIYDIFERVLELAPVLLDSVDRILYYTEDKIFNPDSSLE
jgi:DNA repair ATPase RecN